jgi:hypothetical protein
MQHDNGIMLHNTLLYEMYTLRVHRIIGIKKTDDIRRQVCRGGISILRRIALFWMGQKGEREGIHLRQIRNILWQGRGTTHHNLVGRARLGLQ